MGRLSAPDTARLVAGAVAVLTFFVVGGVLLAQLPALRSAPGMPALATPVYLIAAVLVSLVAAAVVHRLFTPPP